MAKIHGCVQDKAKAKEAAEEVRGSEGGREGTRERLMIMWL